MNKKKLSLHQRLLVAATHFWHVLLVPGNLIFPVHLGQLAGRNLVPAMTGFIITAVGIPILGVAAIGNTHSDGLQALSARIGKRYSYFFTCLLYLTIGPCFAIPRCATTSFTTGIEPLLVNQISEKTALLIFSSDLFHPGIVFLFKTGKYHTMDRQSDQSAVFILSGDPDPICTASSQHRRMGSTARRCL